MQQVRFGTMVKFSSLYSDAANSSAHMRFQIGLRSALYILTAGATNIKSFPWFRRSPARMLEGWSALDGMGKLWKLIWKLFLKYLNFLDGVGLLWMHRFRLFEADSHPIEILQ